MGLGRKRARLGSYNRLGLCRCSGLPESLKVRMQVFFKVRTQVFDVEIKRCWLV